MKATFTERLDQLQSSAHSEFNDVADYVWKIPRFVAYETRIEEKKLRDYFPNGGKTADLRWRHESSKLENTFPYLIAVGNLFSATSLFETYLLLLVELIQDVTGISVSSTKGQGFPRVCAYLRAHFLPPESITFFYQVEAAFKIRNCMAHASGLLSSVRDSHEVERLVRDRIYLSSEDRVRRGKIGETLEEIKVVSSALGKRLQINNKYSYITVIYLRDHFLSLCEALREPVSRKVISVSLPPVPQLS